MVAAGLNLVVFVTLLVFVVGRNDERSTDAYAKASDVERLVKGLRAEVKLRAHQTRQRINESCAITETQQKDDVVMLARTYRYLPELLHSDPTGVIARASLASLPDVERKARQDNAPSYCDAPHLGLPEPDPCVPPRPVSLGGKPGQPKCLNRPSR